MLTFLINYSSYAWQEQTVVTSDLVSAKPQVLGSIWTPSGLHRLIATSGHREPTIKWVRAGVSEDASSWQLAGMNSPWLVKSRVPVEVYYRWCCCLRHVHSLDAWSCLYITIQHVPEHLRPCPPGAAFELSCSCFCSKNPSNDLESTNAQLFSSLSS